MIYSTIDVTANRRRQKMTSSDLGALHPSWKHRMVYIPFMKKAVNACERHRTNTTIQHQMDMAGTNSMGNCERPVYF